jgi:hypothetical protein
MHCKDNCAQAWEHTQEKKRCTQEGWAWENQWEKEKENMYSSTLFIGLKIPNREPYIHLRYN